MLPANESIAIIELAVFPLVLIAISLVLIRHGLKAQAGFIFLASFTIVRIVGASFQIAATKNPTKSNLTWAAILQSLGLAPLLMSSASLLKRVIDQTSRHVRSNRGNDGIHSIVPRIPVVGLLFRIFSRTATASSRRGRVIQCIHLVSTVTLALFITGATRETSDNKSNQSSGKTLIKVGFVILVLIYVVLFVLAATSASEFKRIPAGERRVLIAVLAAIPLLAVRILFGILSIFTNWSDFSIINGSPAIRVCMSLVEEFIIVVMYTFVGLTVPRFEAYESARLEEQVPLAKQSPLPPNPALPYPASYPTPGFSNRTGPDGFPVADRGTVQY